MDQRVLDIIRNRWKHMTDYETQTTSEDWKGGSFIHESGTHPAYYLSSHVLGVRTEIKNGNLFLIIQPRLGDLKHAEGAVLTEFGQVPIKWSKNLANLDFQFEIPPGVSAEVSLPCSSNKAGLVVNGKKWVMNGTVNENRVKFSGRYLQFIATSGRYSGSVINE
ncbi:MAG: hypothetical protein M1426_02415 [Patescibacteria group bacterium]|nr:hypothetical protein [Patescibacteria group bacterium]